VADFDQAAAPIHFTSDTWRDINQGVLRGWARVLDAREHLHKSLCDSSRYSREFIYGGRSVSSMAYGPHLKDPSPEHPSHGLVQRFPSLSALMAGVGQQTGHVKVPCVYSEGSRQLTEFSFV